MLVTLETLEFVQDFFSLVKIGIDALWNIIIESNANLGCDSMEIQDLEFSFW